MKNLMVTKYHKVVDFFILWYDFYFPCKLLANTIQLKNLDILFLRLKTEINLYSVPISDTPTHKYGVCCHKHGRTRYFTPSRTKYNLQRRSRIPS